MKHFTFIYTLLLSLTLALHTQAQKKNLIQYIDIEISANHPDRTYDVGLPATFTLRATRAGVPLDTLTIHYQIGPEMMNPVVSGCCTLKDGVAVIDGGSMQQPGFMTCKASAMVDGKEYTNYLNIAFSPHAITPTQTMPKNFERFWEKSIEKARNIDLEPVVTLAPERCTARTNVYHVRLQHYRKDTYLYGWLAIPKREGRYPAVLCLPGAGVKPVPPEIDLAETGEGMITLAIGVNGIPLDLPQEVYDNLRYGVLKDYGFIHLDSKENYYYRRIYTGCVRAIDYIETLPCYDGSNIGVMGGSQGGALAIVTASLDKRVKALVAYYPALCDVTGYLHNRAGGWPHMFAPKNQLRHNTAQKIETMQYYDVVNFARLLQTPGYYSWGYNDPTCPPTSLYAAYNVIKAPKQLLVAHAAGHWRFPEQTQTTLQWLYQQLTQSK